VKWRGKIEKYIVLYYMTNVKISKRGKAVLRNRKLSSAIAKALTERSHEVSTSGIKIIVDGKEYTIKTASSLTDEDIALFNKR
jgi:hypothetical protein